MATRSIYAKFFLKNFAGEIILDLERWPQHTLKINELMKQESVGSSEGSNEWIEQNFAKSKFGISGEGRHFSTGIVRIEFTRKIQIRQQQMAYAVLGDQMNEGIRPLSMRAITPNDQTTKQPKITVHQET